MWLSGGRNHKRVESRIITLGVSTAGFWHFASLEGSLREIADAGVKGVEFFPYPPHLESSTFGTYERNRVRRLMADLELHCVSVNFTMELNLMALHAGLHELAMSEFRKAIEIGSDLGAPCLVLPVGRLHSLMPAPEDPAQGVRDVADHLILAHVSDCWADRWAHTTVGAGDIDFPAFAKALDDIGYTGDVVYELMDGQDPTPRLKGDVERLVGHGYRL